MSVKYIAKKTCSVASRGSEAGLFSLEEGKEIPAAMEACTITLKTSLSDGLVEKRVSSEAAIETKSVEPIVKKPSPKVK